MRGIDAAQAAGIHVKINAVALKGVNEDEFDDLIRFTHRRGMDLTLIETMPLGEIDGDRLDQYLPLSLVRARLMGRWTFEESPYRTGGPARYVRVKETGGRIGFITPMTHNFCESCNRVRITCTGTSTCASARTTRRTSGRRSAPPRADDLLDDGHRPPPSPASRAARLRHRPPHQEARARPPHERDGRIASEGRPRGLSDQPSEVP
jgi:molybdenum cofactor biosynthesis enzyme MoaA